MSPGAPWGGQWQYFCSACLQVQRMEHMSGSERQDAAGQIDQHAKMRRLERISESLLHRVLRLAGKMGPACFRVPGGLCPLPPALFHLSVSVCAFVPPVLQLRLSLPSPPSRGRLWPSSCRGEQEETPKNLCSALPSASPVFQPPSSPVLPVKACVCFP